MEQRPQGQSSGREKTPGAISRMGNDESVEQLRAFLRHSFGIEIDQLQHIDNEFVEWAAYLLNALQQLQKDYPKQIRLVYGYDEERPAIRRISGVDYLEPTEWKHTEPDGIAVSLFAEQGDLEKVLRQFITEK